MTAKLKCICKGNWRLLVQECQDLFGKKFLDEKGDEYIFYGLVWAEDDLYYGMYREGNCRLLSCVGSLETWGFRLKAPETLIQIHQVDPDGTKDTRMSFLCPGSEPKEHDA